MKRKTAIKQLMSMGMRRNHANDYLNTMHLFSGGSNLYSVEFYKIYGEQWLDVLFLVSEVTMEDDE